MKNLSNSHEIVGQNDKNVKKSQKHEVNVQKNSTLYFQIGLILTLLATYALFEMQFAVQPNELTGCPSPEDEPAFTADVIAYVEPEKKIEKKSGPAQRKKIITKPVFVNEGDKVKEQPLVTDPPLTDNPLISTKAPEVPKPKGPVNVNGVEHLPIFPGCEGLVTRQEQMGCLNSKIEKHIARRFNTDVTDDLGLSGKNRIDVQFTIDQTGRVIDIKTRAPHQKLEKEAKRVIGKIPQLTPGKQNNEPVAVVYTIPIIVKMTY